MTKKCPICHKSFEGSSIKKYCSAKCKKYFENSQRSAPAKKPKPSSKSKKKIVVGNITRPQGLNAIATTYWDRVAPILIKRGHLNVLSEDAFAELCDIYSRLQDINTAIDKTNRSLLQIDDKWITNLDEHKGTETQSFKESALSDLKRKYSQRFLDYCKQFYLTPLSNRGNFNLDDEEEKDPGEEFLS